ncbi:unnamed protein product [Ixodes hexagonus]
MATATYSTDSSPFADREADESILRRVSLVDYASALRELSQLNRVQLAFYLYGVSAPPQRQRLLAFVRGEAEFDVVVKDALDASAVIGTEPLIVEIMYVMEKIALIRKTMNLCKHAAERLYRRPKRIAEFWRRLGTFCEACTDTEAREIFGHFFPDMPCDRSLYAEVLVLSLYENSILKDNDFSRLYEYIKDRYDNELVQTIRPASGERYPMVYDPHGRAVIVNHYSFRDPENVVNLSMRNGTSRDVEALRCLWEEFGFKVEVWHDKTGIEVKQSLADLGRSDFTNSDAFVMVILSHGYNGGFYASDCERISLETVESFLCDQCETLKGKPKVICVQACQTNDSVDGTNYEALGTNCDASGPTSPGNLQDAAVGSTDGVGGAESRADMLKFMSTIPNYVSYRDEDRGSVFVQEFVSVVRENWRDRDLLQMAAPINDRVASRAIPVLMNGESILWDRQVSEVRTTLRKHLYLYKR